MKKQQNFEMVAGDTIKLDIGVLDKDAGGSKNLVHSTIKWVLYDQDNQTVKVTKTTSSGITIVDALAGQCIVTLLPADTVALEPKQYYQEAEVTDEVGDVTTIFSGLVTILPTRI